MLVMFIYLGCIIIKLLHQKERHFLFLFVNSNDDHCILVVFYTTGMQHKEQIVWCKFVIWFLGKSISDQPILCTLFNMKHTVSGSELKVDCFIINGMPRTLYLISGMSVCVCVFIRILCYELTGSTEGIGFLFFIFFIKHFYIKIK